MRLGTRRDKCADSAIKRCRRLYIVVSPSWNVIKAEAQSKNRPALVPADSVGAPGLTQSIVTGAIVAPASAL